MNKKKAGFTMRRRPIPLIDLLIYFLVYPMLFLIITGSILGTGLLLFKFMPRISEIGNELTIIKQSRRWAVLPIEPMVIDEPTPYFRRLKILPNPMPTATGTPTTIPSPTFTPLPTQPPTSVAVAAVKPASDAIPVVYPTSEAIPAANPTFGAIPVIYPTPGSPPPPTATLAPSPAISPTATLTPLPEYDYMLAEFFNSPTANSFLMVYVAIVDPKEIPVGDMKIVGVRQDHNLTYESPLSTWHYEGYSAPGKVIKSGNAKFEPPGGIESTSWVLHLEDAHGNRQSEDVSFDVDVNDKQWYFIKFRRKY